jgi:hypothetical protein
VTSVENTEKCFKTLTSRTKDGEESESENEKETKSQLSPQTSGDWSMREM